MLLVATSSVKASVSLRSTKEHPIMSMFRSAFRSQTDLRFALSASSIPRMGTQQQVPNGDKSGSRGDTASTRSPK